MVKGQGSRITQLHGDGGTIQSGQLICWDAPLTPGAVGGDRCYYERPIEQFFRTQDWSVPDGISVRAYAGCPHWAVSRASVGLPRVGRFDSTDLPFTLCAQGNPPGNGGNYIVEVHPAVALWLWCRESSDCLEPWMYKKDKAIRERLWHVMKAKLSEFELDRPPKDDDEFDAYVAYLLGKKWLENSGVTLLGNAATGSFLVPDVLGLSRAFAESPATRA